MLFPYKYISHSIEKMQTYIDFLFLEVWCKAEGDFSIDKLNDCPELKEIVLDIYHNDRITKDYLYGPIEKVYNVFKTLSDSAKVFLGTSYRKNNEIEALCNHSDEYIPLTYKDLHTSFPTIAYELKMFFINLFENVINLATVKQRIGSIDEHYKAFLLENKEELCPFCGLSDLKGSYVSKREAYDHYLPKTTYAFSSINFRNLAPMCHECNSSYKLQQDPLCKIQNRDPLHSTENTRRKAFYPYMTDKIDVKIEINLLTSDLSNLKPDDIELTISSDKYQEEVETWKEVFGIEERYKDKFRKMNSGKYWFLQTYQECRNYGKTPEDILANGKSIAQEFPWAGNNFLKIPFLEACARNHLFGL
ncbi:hypothetical protein V6C32_11335 [Desulforamulus ruminis]|uniref:hypothetical protein n=1 Tax=Desulforamulus ruminis TaxID=1564 RepID=UPI002FD9E3B9